MTETELEEILKSLEAAIVVYQSPKGILTAAEISVKTMLMVLHGEVTDQLLHAHSLSHVSGQDRLII